MSGFPAGYFPSPSRTAWSWLLSILLALVPLSVALVVPGKAIPPGLLFLCGVALLTASPAARRSYGAAWPVTTAALLMVGFGIATVAAHRAGWRPLDHDAHVLLYLVIAAVFSQPLQLRLIWGGFATTAIALGAVCVVQHYGHALARAYGLNGGPSAAIQVATVLFGLGLLSLVRLLDLHTRSAERLLHGTALALAMYGALLTESRGPLLAFIPMVALVLVLHGRRTGRWRGALLLAISVCLGLVLAMASLRGQMLHRFAAVQQEVASFDPADAASGAVRERLEMWRTAVRAAASHPLLGVGPGDYGRYVKAEIAAGRSNPVIAGYNQPHNEYLRAAATGGVPGLLVLLLVFALPLGYFLRHLRQGPDAIALPASAGIAIVGLYALCALTDSVFYRVMPQSFYFFLVLGLAVQIGRLHLARVGTESPPAAGPGGPGGVPAERTTAGEPVRPLPCAENATPSP